MACSSTSSMWTIGAVPLLSRTRRVRPARYVCMLPRFEPGAAGSRRRRAAATGPGSRGCLPCTGTAARPDWAVAAARGPQREVLMQVGEVVPDFELPDETGAPRRLSDLLA